MKRINILFIVVAVLFLFSSTQATTWYVHPDSALNSIQAGLDSCATNDTVLVAPATYVENIIWPLVNGIKLIGSGMDSTIIDGNNQASVLRFDDADIIDTTTIVRGFTLTNGNALPPWPQSLGGGICIFSSSPILESLQIIGNTADDYGGGISIWGSSSDPIIRYSIIADNTAIARGGFDCRAGAPILDHVTVSGNDPGGLYFNTAGYAQILNSISAFNMYYGIRLEGISPQPTFIAIGYSDTYDAVQVLGYAGIDWLEGNIDTNPMFVDQGNSDFHLQAGSPCIDAGDPAYPYDPDSTITDMGAFYFNQTGTAERLVVRHIAPNNFLCATIFNGSLVLPKDKNCRVFDITGRVVEPRHIRPGVYFIEVDGKITQKIIKIK